MNSIVDQIVDNQIDTIQTKRKDTKADMLA